MENGYISNKEYKQFEKKDIVLKKEKNFIYQRSKILYRRN